MLANAVHLGLLLGLRHASDADHVCTIASLLRAGQSRGQALRTAAWWGLGHSLSFFAVGLSLVLFDVHLPPLLDDVVGLGVAGLLIALGVNQWRHAPCPAPPTPARARGVASAGLGFLHGLAGSAGVSLLALTSMGDRHAALVYLALFGAGTVLGMVLVTAALSWPLSLAARFDERWRTAILRAAAAASIALGLWLLLSPHL